MTASLTRRDPMDRAELTAGTASLSGYEAEWWAGNVRNTDFSGTLLGAHLCHAALMSCVPGAFIIQEAARFQPGIPLSEQGMVFMPHLAGLGIAVGSGGEILSTYPYFVIGVLHFFVAAFCCAGGLFHTIAGEAKLGDYPEGSWAAQFDYDWDDFESTSSILGHHLLCLGVACLLFACNAAFGNGLYDPLVGEVRQITPNLNPITLLGYLFGFANGEWTPLGMAAVNNMEDLVGGHFLVAIVDIAGAAFHIINKKPTAFFNNRLIFSFPNGGVVRAGICNSEAILSYSVASVGFIAISSAIFTQYCDIAFAPEFYGVDRSGAASIQLILGLNWMVFGGLWHSIRGERLHALKNK